MHNLFVYYKTSSGVTTDASNYDIKIHRGCLQCHKHLLSGKLCYAKRSLDVRKQTNLARDRLRSGEMRQKEGARD